MKRSHINQLMASARAFLAEHRFVLPPFADWRPEDWRSRGAEVSEIVATGLGWDITDFGSGDFRRCGLFLFTLRNGRVSNWQTQQGKLYAEKIMVVEEEQRTPLHFHWKKMEDIINRGGGRLAVRLFRSTADEDLDREREVSVECDGVVRTLPAGGVVELWPGESVTLPAGCYHEFWGVGGRVLVGEVSMVNDDRADNRFHEPRGRFPEIEEDEAPLHLLCTDYPRYWRAAS